MTDLLNKYRPKTWGEYYGNGTAVEALRSAVRKKAGRAYLIAGPSGIGKTTLARIAARELGGADVEIVDIDAATNTGIEAMREVCSTLQYRPLSAEAKAVICDEAHALSKAAVTSLLKPLEEPPSYVYWFLCTTEPGKIPQAVQTRCIPIHLKPLSEKGLFKIIQGIVHSEDHKIDEEILWICAEEADGSPRQAISNLVACWVAKDENEARSLLQTARYTAEAVDLARALIDGRGWAEICKALDGLKENNVTADTVRYTVLAYVSKVAMNPKGNPARALNILRAFNRPFDTTTGMAPLIVACAEACVEEF